MVVFAFVPGIAAALLLFGVGSASALVAGDTATITGTYTTQASTTSSDPGFAPCTALPQPSEPFWAFVDGNEHISDSVPGACSYTSSPDAGQAGVTDYLLAYSYGASWGIVISPSDPLGTMTLTMSFHTINNIVATATYVITAPTTSSTASTTNATTTNATTSTTTAATTNATTGATTQTTPPPTTATTPTPVPPPTTTEATAPTTTAAQTTAPPSTSTIATTTATAGPVVRHRRYMITTPATTHAKRTGNTVTLTISTNSTRRMLLCYRIMATATATCRAGHGTWKVHIPATKPGVITRLFLIKINATVVATKTITIRVA